MTDKIPTKKAPSLFHRLFNIVFTSKTASIKIIKRVLEYFQIMISLGRVGKSESQYPKEVKGFCIADYSAEVPNYYVNQPLFKTLIMYTLLIPCFIYITCLYLFNKNAWHLSQIPSETQRIILNRMTDEDKAGFLIPTNNGVFDLLAWLDMPINQRPPFPASIRKQICPEESMSSYSTQTPEERFLHVSDKLNEIVSGNNLQCNYSGKICH